MSQNDGLSKRSGSDFCPLHRGHLEGRRRTREAGVRMRASFKFLSVRHLQYVVLYGGAHS
jgi:hypothetical protein